MPATDALETAGATTGSDVSDPLSRMRKRHRASEAHQAQRAAEALSILPGTPQPRPIRELCLYDVHIGITTGGEGLSSSVAPRICTISTSKGATCPNRARHRARHKAPRSGGVYSQCRPSEQRVVASIVGRSAQLLGCRAGADRFGGRGGIWPRANIAVFHGIFLTPSDSESDLPMIGRQRQLSWVWMVCDNVARKPVE